MTRHLLLLTLLALAVPARAATPRQLIDAGRFAQAYQDAAPQGTAAALILAAEAANAYALYRATTPGEKEMWFSRAEAAARQAIRLDPANPEAYFQLASAQGRLAQYRGVLASLNLASSIRDNLEKALELNPEHSPAIVVLAVWNLELAQKGVGWIYGASLKRVEPLFRRALALDPAGPIQRVEYAKALLRLDQPQRAREVLDQALRLAPRNWIERAYQDEARALLNRLD